VPECSGEGPGRAASADGAAPLAAELWRAVGAGPDYLAVLNPSGVITWINRAAPGVLPESVLGQNVRDLTPESRRAALEEVLDKVRAGSAHEAFETHFPTPGEVLEFDCRFLPVRHQAELASILVHAREVTAARRATASLRANEERFRALAETSPDAICLFDATGIIRFANPAAHHMLGYDAETLFGASGWKLIHPDDRERMREVQAQIHARPGQSVEVSRWRLLHQDGRWRWIDSTATNLLDLPSVGAVVSTYRDVTQRVELEEQLRQAQKMEAIGLLAGGVAHDFNNLLTVILASADHARSLVPADHPAREDLQGIAQAARSASELTQKLLTFSRRQVPMLSAFDLRDEIQGFGSLLRRVVGEDVSIEIEAPDSLPMEGDRGQIQQLLLNLATNARQAMPGGGTLRVRARRIDPSSQSPSGQAELEVIDTGLGMDEATHARLFEPFFSTRPGGTGLGMPVVLNVVQDHQGSIAVESQAGQGTTVRVLLPLRERPAASQGQRRHDAVMGTETVLLVEDEVLLRELLARALRAFGYTVLAAGSGEEGLALFEQQGARIALVVMDVVLPKMSGKEALSRMKVARPDLRAVLMTGYAPDAAGVAELAAPRRIALLQKPFLGAELAAELRDLIDAA